MAAFDVEAVLAQRVADALRMLAIISRQQLFGPQIVEFDAGLPGQPVLPADDEPESSVNSGQLSSRSHPSSSSAAMPSSASPFFSISANSRVAAQELEFEPVELTLDLVEERNQQRNVDGMGQRDPAARRSRRS